MADTGWDLADTGDATPTPTDNSSFWGSLIRAAAENPKALAAMGIRMGSGTLGAEGGVTGGAIGAGGETLAQMLENGSLDLTKLNKSRIAEEGAIGAIPFAQTYKEGKALESFVRGAGHSALGVAGRKAADVVSGTDPDALKKWSLNDALPVALGGAMGVGIGKMSAVPKAAPAVKDLQTLLAEHAQDADAFGTAAATGPLKGKGLDKIAQEAADLHAGGNPDHAEALRQAALRTGTWQGKNLEQEISRIHAQNPAQAQDLRMSAVNSGTGTNSIYVKAANVVKANAKEAELQKQKIADAIETQREADVKQAALDEAKRRIDELRKTGAVKESASEVVGGVDPLTGEKFSHTTKIAPKSENSDAEDLLGGGGSGSKGKGNGPSGGNSLIDPNEGRPPGMAGQIYDLWRKVGAAHEDALDRAAEGVVPPPKPKPVATPKIEDVLRAAGYTPEEIAATRAGIAKVTGEAPPVPVATNAGLSQNPVAKGLLKDTSENPTLYHGSAELGRQGGLKGDLRLDVSPDGRPRVPGEGVDSLGTWFTSSRPDAEAYSQSIGEDGVTRVPGHILEGQVTSPESKGL